MNQYMLNQWNHKVRNNDEVIILGDYHGEMQKKRKHCWKNCMDVYI